jgi:hypothetical protein
MILLLLSGCTDNLFKSFSSSKFMGEELGATVSSNGVLYYDDSKGCFLKLNNGGIADCTLKTKNVYKIRYYCKDGDSEITMNGYKCGATISLKDQKDYKRLCNDRSFDDGYYLNQKNYYIWVNKSRVVTRMVMTQGLEDLPGEGEDAYSEENCLSVPQKRIDENEKRKKVQIEEKNGRELAKLQNGENGAKCFDAALYYLDLFNKSPKGDSYIDIEGLVLGKTSVDKYALTLKDTRACFVGMLKARGTEREPISLGQPAEELTALYFENDLVVCHQYSQLLRQQAVELKQGRYVVIGKYKEVFTFSSGRSSIYLTNCNIKEF